MVTVSWNIECRRRLLQGMPRRSDSNIQKGRFNGFGGILGYLASFVLHLCLVSSPVSQINIGAIQVHHFIRQRPGTAKTQISNRHATDQDGRMKG